MSFKSILTWFFILFASLNYAASSTEKVNQTMDIHVTGQQFFVDLPSNPTTGYQWQVVSFDRSIFALAKTTYIAPKQGTIGAGGTFRLSFVIRRGKTLPDTSNMVLVYKRPWEQTAARELHVTLKFK